MIVATFSPASSQRLGATNGSAASSRDQAVDGDPGVGGWYYMGSHNFGPNAWVSVCIRTSP